MLPELCLIYSIIWFWMLEKNISQHKKLSSFHTKSLREIFKIYGIYWPKEVSNEYLHPQCHLNKPQNNILKGRFTCKAQHVLRSEQHRMSKVAQH